MKIELTGNRRTFLKNTTVLGGVAISLLLGHKPAATDAVPYDPPAKASNGAGYRLTEHIKKYYETARS